MPGERVLPAILTMPKLRGIIILAVGTGIVKPG